MADLPESSTEAGSIIQFRFLLSLDLAAGGDGTADNVRTFITGDADGNVAHMVLDYEVLGSRRRPGDSSSRVHEGPAEDQRGKPRGATVPSGRERPRCAAPTTSASSP